MDGDGLFNSGESERQKEEGMDRVATNRAERLEEARSIALYLAMALGEVTADHVGRHLKHIGHGPDWLGNAAGSIFKGPWFHFTGKRVKSARTSNHARELKVWRLTEAGRKAAEGGARDGDS